MEPARVIDDRRLLRPQAPVNPTSRPAGPAGRPLRGAPATISRVASQAVCCNTCAPSAAVRGSQPSAWVRPQSLLGPCPVRPRIVKPGRPPARCSTWRS